MSDETPRTLVYAFSREGSLASTRFAARRIVPSVNKLWIGVLALTFVGGVLFDLLPAALHLRYFEQFRVQFTYVFIGVVAVAAAIVVPRLAKKLALSDLRALEPDGFDVSFTSAQDSLEVSWKNCSYRVGWADITQLMIGVGHLIVINGAATAFSIPLACLGDDTGHRKFIRSCAARLSPEALERSQPFIGPFLT